MVDLITNLANQVNALVAGNVLSSSDGSLLTSKLAAAAADFNLPTPDIAGGDALMNAFTSQVTVFLNQHKLTNAQAQPLITASKVIIADSKTIG